METEDEREAILERCLDRLNAGETVDHGELRRLYPDFAEELIGQIEMLGALGGALGGESKVPAELATLGDYRLRRQVGRGGMGVVYEAWQCSMDRRVALKVIPPGVAADTRTLTRFVREAKIAGKLHHPNVVPVYGLGVEGGTPWYAMEFIEGETLAQVLDRAVASRGEKTLAGLRRAIATVSGVFAAAPGERTIASDREGQEGPAPSGFIVSSPQPVPEGAVDDALRGPPAPSGLSAEEVDLQYCLNVARAFAGVAEGLDHAHRRGVIHRDLKPSNLILDRNGALRILDFGLARLEGEKSLTRTGDFLGTPLYMSPEQAMARRVKIDHRTDIYSLGATLYEMLTLSPPFQGKDHQEMLSHIIVRDARPLRSVNPRIPRDLETIVQKCLEKDPEARYRTAEALAQDLRRLTRGDPIEARPQPPWERWARRAWRQRLRVGLAAALALFAITAGLFALKILRDESLRREGEYQRLVTEALEELPLERLETFPREGTVGEGEREGRALLESFRILDEERIAKHIAKSIESFEGAKRLLPDRPEARYHLARALRILGDDSRCQAEIDELLRRAPGFPPALALRGDLGAEGAGPSGGWSGAWLRAGRAAAARNWKEAEEAYSAVLDETSRSGEPFLGASLEVLIGRGVARLESSGTEGAKRDFLTASLRWPRASLPALLLAKAYLAEKRPEDADAWLREKHAALAGSWQRDAFAFQALQMFEAADANQLLLLWVDRLEPGRQQDLARMQALLWSERLEESRSAREVIEIGERLLRASPEDALVHAFVAMAASQVVGESKKFDEHRARAEALGQNDPEVLTLVAGMSPTEMAIALCEKALEKSPGFSPARFRLAEYQILADRPEPAIPVLEEMVKRGREPAKAHLYLGIACYLKALDSEAIDHYQEALRLRPGWTWAEIRIAQIQWRQRKPQETVRIYESILKKAPSINSKQMLASFLQPLGRLDEALDLFCQSLPRSPRPPISHHWCFSNILLSTQTIHSFAPLDGFVEAFEPYLREHGHSPWVLQSMALALAHAPRARDLPRALALAEEAVEVTGRKDARFLASLAAVQFAGGAQGKAIRILEEATEKDFFDILHFEQLAAYRQSFLPRVASVSSIDALLGRRGEDPRIDEFTVDPELLHDESEMAAELAAYLEGCRLQSAKKNAEAADQFAALSESSAHRNSFLARQVECLRAISRSREAMDLLTQAIAQRERIDRILWELWWIVGDQDLSMTPDELQRNLPVESARTHQLPGHREDVLWLLERLKTGAPLRIDCGLNEDHADPVQGEWSQDRFYVGGWRQTGQNQQVASDGHFVEDTGEFEGEIHGAEYQRPYRTARQFPRRLPDSGYRIPLPRGNYSVVLHFAELMYPHPGRRRFDVFLEGQKVLPDYAPSDKGYATVDLQSLPLEVRDGFLDLGLIGSALKQEGMISAIEIRRVSE